MLNYRDGSLNVRPFYPRLADFALRDQWLDAGERLDAGEEKPQYAMHYSANRNPAFHVGANGISGRYPNMKAPDIGPR